MKKSELLNLIVMANKAEEDMVSNVAKNLASALEWFKGTKEERALLEDGLKKIEDESLRHAKMLNAMRDYVLKENKDVY